MPCGQHSTQHTDTETQRHTETHTAWCSCSDLTNVAHPWHVHCTVDRQQRQQNRLGLGIRGVIEMPQACRARVKLPQGPGASWRTMLHGADRMAATRGLTHLDGATTSILRTRGRPEGPPMHIIAQLAARTCTVLPRPISSARMQPLCLASHCPLPWSSSDTSTFPLSACTCMQVRSHMHASELGHAGLETGSAQHCHSRAV